MKPEETTPPRLKTSLRALYGLLLLVSALVLSACAPRTTQTPVSEPAPVGLPDNLVCEIETVTESDLSRATDGAILAAYTYRLPVMGLYRRNGEPVTEENAADARERDAVAMADNFNRAFEQWKAEADFPALEALAWENYEQKKQEKVSWDYHYEQGLESEVYKTDRFVSVSGRFYYYAGGAHPNTVLLGWNYDMETASFFYAGQLFQNTQAVTDELLRLSRERAAELNVPAEEFYWEDYADIINAWSEKSAAVTFDEYYMNVSYSPYDIASYAAGEQIFSIPRSWLKPYLNQYGERLLSK